MHVLSLSIPLDTGPAYGVLETGSWLMQDQNAFECAMLADRGKVSLRNEGLKLGYNWGTKILIMRSGAIGDLLLMGPAIKAFRAGLDQDYSPCVDLCCNDRHKELFNGTDVFDNIISYPLKIKKMEGMPNDYHVIISLEDVMELANEIHATDAFAQALGVTVTDYKPIFKLTDEERASAGVMMSGKRPKVGVQLCASTKNRNYPMDQWAKVIIGLEERGWEVFIFGKPGQVPALPWQMQRTFIHDMSQSGMTLRETAAVLSHCNAFVGVDSALIHLCHALDIPAVGLYGPFHWVTRTSKAPLTQALMGTGECANCRWHAKLGQHFPDKECRKTQRCSVLASITPERIIAKVDSLRP